MPEVKSTCCCCGVGCGVIIATDGERITGVRGDPDHAANFGRLCAKGSTLHLTTGLEDRLLYPEPRNTQGEEATTVHVSGQILTEDYYVFNQRAKDLERTGNIDTGSRLCTSSSISRDIALAGVQRDPGGKSARRRDSGHAASTLVRECVKRIGFK
jgi:assimilatory nitrate reductase catalytic subunit